MRTRRLATRRRQSDQARSGSSAARLAVYTLVLASSSLQVGIAPLLPGYARRYHLSSLADGALLAATALATFAVALPAGRLADRLGARRLTLVASIVMVVGAVSQAAAHSYLVLLAARLVFGVGYGIVWTAGVALLAGDSGRGSAVGGVVTASGVGGIVGPAFTGLVAGAFGVAAPYLATAVALAGATLLLACAPSAPVLSRAAPSATTSQLWAAMRHRSTVAAAAAVVVAGVAASVSSLVVPLELHAAGFSAADIGLLFSLAGGLFIVVSATTTFAGARAVTARTAFRAMAVVVVSLSAASLSTASLAVVVMLCAMSASRAVLWTVAYPLAASRAQAAGVGVGVTTGLLNAVWAATAFLSPLLAGVVDGRLGARATFAVAQGASLAVVVVGWWYVRRLRRLAPGDAGGTPTALAVQEAQIEALV